MDKEKQWGHFDIAQREYVITDPMTPTPWMNYLFNDDYYCLISNTGGGYSFYKSARDYRLLRMRLNSVPFDRPGRYIYVRDRENGNYWSTGWAPVMPSTEEFSYKCRHGFGYTIIEGEMDKIKTEVTYTVAEKEPFEIWSMKVENKDSKGRKLTFFPYAELCLFQAMHDMQNFQYTYNVARCEVEDNIIHHVTAAYDRPYYSFFAASESPNSYETDREVFIGNYRSESNPVAVENGQCSNSDIVGGNPIASFAIDVDLAPGETKELVFMVGYHEDGKAGAKAYTEQYCRPGIGSELVSYWREYWNEILSANQIETPDEDFNLVVNQWLAYQSQVTFRVSRGPSIYEGGIGRGMGTRDSSQDILGALCLTPDQPRDLLLSLGQIQFREGSMYHQFFPLSGEGDGGNSFSDDSLWYIMAVAEYIKASGDWGILETEYSWADDETLTPMYDHLVTAIKYTQQMKGPHGLPLILLADWNDMLQISGMVWGDDHHGRDNLKAESVMVAFLYYRALADMVELAKRTGRESDAADFSAELNMLKEKIDEHAWDGNWFRRAFDNNSEPLGTAGAEEAEVWLNAQTWAILSGAEQGDRAKEAMEIVKDRLSTEYGLILLDPPYSHWIPESPSITTYPAGLKENGGIFCHTNPWGVIAETMIGNGDQAFDYFKKIMPTTHQEMQETYKAEPYVYAQMIAGKHHPQFGLARNSWLTGAVAWNYVAATNYIMGVKADYEGLRIDPCMPADWDHCKVQRKFRGIMFDITIDKPAGICRASREGYNISGLEIETDFGVVEGNLLKITDSGQTPAKVEVRVKIS